MILYHGWGKLAGCQDEPLHLPNLLALDGWREEFHTFSNYIGIGSELSDVLVTWFETFGCLQIIMGLLTRFNALGLFITLMVAWVFQHHLRISGPNSGEVAFACAFGFLLLVLAGPGNDSLNRRFGH